MATLFWSAALLGIVFCASPGIVAAESLRRGLARGFWSVVLLQLGSLIGDASWAVVALIGIAFIVEYALVRLLLGVAGAGLLLSLAWSALRSAVISDSPAPTETSTRGDFAAGAALSLGNPFAVAFWLGVGNSTITAHVAHPTPIHLAIFLGAFMLSGLLWAFVMAGLVTWGRRFVNQTLFRTLNAICGVILIYFAAQLIMTAISR